MMRLTSMLFLVFSITNCSYFSSPKMGVKNNKHSDNEILLRGRLYPFDQYTISLPASEGLLISSNDSNIHVDTVSLNTESRQVFNFTFLEPGPSEITFSDQSNATYKINSDIRSPDFETNLYINNTAYYNGSTIRLSEINSNGYLHCQLKDTDAHLNCNVTQFNLSYLESGDINTIIINGNVLEYKHFSKLKALNQSTIFTITDAIVTSYNNTDYFAAPFFVKVIN